MADETKNETTQNENTQNQDAPAQTLNAKQDDAPATPSVDGNTPTTNTQNQDAPAQTLNAKQDDAPAAPSADGNTPTTNTPTAGTDSAPTTNTPTAGTDSAPTTGTSNENAAATQNTNTQSGNEASTQNGGVSNENDKGTDSSFNWKTAAIAAGITLGVALLVIAIILIVKKVRKNKAEEAEKDKDNDKSKGNDKDKKKGKDKDAKTTEKEGNDKPETKNFTLLVNGEEKEFEGKLNKETGGYQVRIPRTRKGVQDSIVKVSNKNNKIITETQQKRDQANDELVVLKDKVNNLQGELDAKKHEQEQINQFSKVLGNMGANLVGSLLGSNVIELGDLEPAPIANKNAAMSTKTVNNAMKKEKNSQIIPLFDDNRKEIQTKVVKTSLEAANKAKEEEKGNAR